LNNPLRRIILQLILVAFTILFQELLLIRWLGQQIRVLAYFPNIILISAFLGIGLGCLRQGKRSLLALWPGALLLLMGVTAVLSQMVITQASHSEHLWLLYYDLPREAIVINNLYVPIVVTFILSAVCFIPLGQILANGLQECMRLRHALWGYLADIGGSAAGTAAFMAISFLRWSPSVWFVILTGCGIFLAQQRRHRWIAFLAGLVLVGFAYKLDRAEHYSPYYAISTRLDADAGILSILTNGSLHQNAMPVRKADTIGNDYSRTARAGYHIPYGLLPKKPKKVLVLGAGTGNDVAVALDEGAEHVDIVEIDPVILEVGQKMHPNQPYQDSRVRRFNTDARSYLNSTRESYDLIVFGTLDSMTRLSALSNVRLDNFVYTLESMQAAKKRLAPDGGVALYFLVGKKFLGERLSTMIMQAFGEVPLVADQHFRVFNAIFMAGPAFAAQQGAERIAMAKSYASPEPPLLPHDDWPYLYLESAAIAPFYWQIGLSILALALIGIWGAAGRTLRKEMLQLKSIDWQMLLFGMAFLLLETRGMIAMNLLWGTTWFTNAVVIQAIFCTIFAGTLLTSWRPMSFQVAMGGLILSLAAVYFAPVHQVLSMNVLVKSAVSVFVMGAPVFFASIAFAILYAQRSNTAAAFGWNLLGAVLGGLLEMSSMVFGLKNLVLLAMVCYLGALYVQVSSTNPARRRHPVTLKEEPAS
jgi:spermidine synthase